MANQIILLPQKFTYLDITKQFPSGKFIKKVFFQCELRSLAGGNATFAVIAYPGWKEPKSTWTIGTKVTGETTGAGKAIAFTEVAFANNELLLATKISRKNKKQHKKAENCNKKNKEKSAEQRLLEFVKNLAKDKALAKKSFFLFEGKISENPHIEYDVTLDMGGTTLNVNAKPSPPARPSDA